MKEAIKEDERQELLDALKFELEFHERGGYEPSVREPHKGLSTFQDSPSCLNFALGKKEHPCSECWLMDMVPLEKRGEAVPCHHIPLNDRGETVAVMGGPGDDPRVSQAVCDWLRRTIRNIEETSA